MPVTEDLALADLPARIVADRVRSGTLTATAVTTALLDRIAAREPTVRAFVHLDPEKALAEARRIDRAEKKGVLAGVALGVKDVIDTATLPTEYGSAAYKGVQPAWDAPCVAIARHQGAVLMGKTVTTEFAMAAPGPTTNPWNPAHTPGGSSSGSCAAVGAGLVHVAYGTQTSGSTIRPAAYCGIVGVKPSFGLLDRTAIKPLADSLDTLGILARDVRDAAWYISVLSGRPGIAAPDTLPVPKVALFRTPIWDETGPGTRLALERAMDALGRAGSPVGEAPVPDWFAPLGGMLDRIMDWETPKALFHEMTVLREKLAPKTLEFMDPRLAVTLEQYQAALDHRDFARHRMETVFGDADVLIAPAAPDEAPEGLATTGNPAFNKFWTILRLPAVTVPAGLGPKGLPVGVQVIGRYGQDARVLAAAAFLEDALAAAPVA